jgi:hypothetical protein
VCVAYLWQVRRWLAELNGQMDVVLVIERLDDALLVTQSFSRRCQSSAATTHGRPSEKLANEPR